MGDIFHIPQVTSAGQKIKVEPPATAGRRRLKNYGLRSSAKPRGRARKATSDTGAKRGRARKTRAAAKPYVTTAAAAAATPQRTGRGRCVKADGAGEVPLETVTTESESTIDLQAEMYVSKILPDPATILYPERGNDLAYECSEELPTPPPHRRRGGRTHRPTPVRRRRRVAVDGDERVVCEAQSGRWSSLLPLGTVVRRPSVKLVQLVAQAIHESPHRVLRVTHVYAALQNRYPFYMLQDKKRISSWKSSVRHALFQKWFMKLRPTSGMYETVQPRSFFWGLNYSNRPHDWQMPPGLPRLFLPTDNEGEQRDDEASTLCSGLHLKTEPPSETTAFGLELQHELFAPPEPQSPGVKPKLSTVQCSEFAPVTSAAQSEDDLVSVGSPASSIPQIVPVDLWKSETMNPVGWPRRAGEQAWQQPTVIASPAPPSVWHGMYFQPAFRFGRQRRRASARHSAVDQGRRPVASPRLDPGARPARGRLLLGRPAQAEPRQEVLRRYQARQDGSNATQDDRGDGDGRGDAPPSPVVRGQLREPTAPGAGPVKPSRGTGRRRGRDDERGSRHPFAGGHRRRRVDDDFRVRRRARGGGKRRRSAGLLTAGHVRREMDPDVDVWADRSTVRPRVPRSAQAVAATLLPPSTSLAPNLVESFRFP